MLPRFVLILFLFFFVTSCSSPLQQQADASLASTEQSVASNDLEAVVDPVEIYRSFEESLKGSDIEIPMSFIHDDAKLTYAYYPDDGEDPEQVEVSNLAAIRGQVLIWMDDSNQEEVVIINMEREGNTVYFWLEFQSPDGWSGAQDGYAVIEDNKIILLHYNPAVAYHVVE